LGLLELGKPIDKEDHQLAQLPCLDYFGGAVTEISDYTFSVLVSVLKAVGASNSVLIMLSTVPNQNPKP
jgi:hypothetical protein